MLAAAWPNESEAQARMMLYNPLGPPPQTELGRAANKARKESLQASCPACLDSMLMAEIRPASDSLFSMGGHTLGHRAGEC